MSNQQVYSDSRRTIAKLQADSKYTSVVEVYKEDRLIAALFERVDAA